MKHLVTLPVVLSDIGPSGLPSLWTLLIFLRSTFHDLIWYNFNQACLDLRQFVLLKMKICSSLKLASISFADFKIVKFNVWKTLHRLGSLKNSSMGFLLQHASPPAKSQQCQMKMFLVEGQWVGISGHQARIDSQENFIMCLMVLMIESFTVIYSSMVKILVHSSEESNRPKTHSFVKEEGNNINHSSWER